METEITVFRSADATAREDAQKVQEILAQDGIAAWIYDDSAPGVLSGAFEVRVKASDSARAEELIAPVTREEDTTIVDDSSDMDLVTVFDATGATAEWESVTVKSLLESSGIPAVLVGDTRFPNLPDEVRVPRECVDRAKQLLADALAAGPQAAEEAEAAGELP